MSVESKETPTSNRLEELKELITNAPVRIENEFTRTSNDWLSCFGSSVFQVETYLESPKLQTLLAPATYEQAQSRLAALKERLHQLRERFPDKETVPPEKIKQELLEALDVLKKGN